MTIAGLIILGIGAIFLVLGIIFVAVGKTTWKCTGTTTGQIVDMCYNAYDYNHGGTGNKAVGISTGGGDAMSRCPIFEYQVNGVTYRKASNVSYNKGQIAKKMNRKFLFRIIRKIRRKHHLVNAVHLVLSVWYLL